MASAARRSGGAVGTGMLEGVYRLVMRRTPIYVTFVLVGAFFGERMIMTIKDEEIAAGVFELNADSSPVPDGYHGGFIRNAGQSCRVMHV
ncbi:hypothetical protein IFM89_024887 [Coptis chinensis]|uniref:Uncharacterized protein n=1 Tax=Coptis chinensis TaxID=261450 RepID=A0A835H819_9MAGN|nr:hypothetical protein IFM89_024887 [Coptis chinensis]